MLIDGHFLPSVGATVMFRRGSPVNATRSRGMQVRLRVPWIQLAAAVVSLTGALEAQQQQSAGLSTADIAARALPATVTVLAIGAQGDTIGQGSGFVIRSDGVVVTNFHVLRGASAAIVVLANRERFTHVRALDGDSALDIALLKVPSVGLRVLPTRATVPRVGERVIAIGSPVGLANTVSDGIVSASRVIDGRELVQMTAPISPGSSGGAVLDASGRVFAISTLYVEGQALNFAIPVRYALGLLSEKTSELTIEEVFAPTSSVKRVLGPESITTHGSPELLAGLRYVTVNVEWRGTEGMKRLFSDQLMRVTIEAHLRREGLRVSDNPRVLFDSGGVEVTLHVSSFEVGNIGVTVSSLILMVTDIAIPRRAPRHVAVLPTWISGNTVQVSPTNQHERIVLESLRVLLDTFTNTLAKAPRQTDPPPRPIRP